MTKVSPNNRNETKPDTFSMGHIQIWRHIIFYQNVKVFQWLSKSKFLSFMTKVNPSIENETKSEVFHWAYPNLTSFFIGCKILKCFNDFYNWHLSISLQKWAQTSKVKSNETGHVQIWQYFSLLTMWYSI